MANMMILLVAMWLLMRLPQTTQTIAAAIVGQMNIPMAATPVAITGRYTSGYA